MIITLHELKHSWKALLAWSVVVCGMMAACILVYPDLSTDMEGLNDLFGNMGAFSQAFGMDVLHFGTFQGYFGIECGNVAGLGGGLFAGITGASILAKVEGGHHTDYYLTMPISRTAFYFQKLLALTLQVILLNGLLFLTILICTNWIGQELTGDMVRLLTAYTFCQLEIACMAFGLSAFLKRTSLPLGLCLPLGLYFLHLLANLSQTMEHIDWLSPYSCCDPAQVLTQGIIPAGPAWTGFCLSGLALLAGWIRYRNKDLA